MVPSVKSIHKGHVCRQQLAINHTEIVSLTLINIIIEWGILRPGRLQLETSERCYHRLLSAWQNFFDKRYFSHPSKIFGITDFIYLVLFKLQINWALFVDKLSFFWGKGFGEGECHPLNQWDTSLFKIFFCKYITLFVCVKLLYYWTMKWWDAVKLLLMPSQWKTYVLYGSPMKDADCYGEL